MLKFFSNSKTNKVFLTVSALVFFDVRKWLRSSSEVLARYMYCQPGKIKYRCRLQCFHCSVKNSLVQPPLTIVALVMMRTFSLQLISRFYTRDDAEDALRYVNGTRLDERIVRCDWDAGFVEGRQYGRGRSGGQVIYYAISCSRKSIVFSKVSETTNKTCFISVDEIWFYNCASSSQLCYCIQYINARRCIAKRRSPMSEVAPPFVCTCG